MALKERIKKIIFTGSKNKTPMAPNAESDIPPEVATPSTETISANPTVEQINALFGGRVVGGAALNAATYFACMQIRCNAIAKLPIHVMRRTNSGGIERALKHPLSYLLGSRPNPYMTAHDLLWMTQYQLLDCGNAYWIYEFHGGLIRAIYPLESSRVQVYVDDAGIIFEKNAVFYIYNSPQNGSIFFTRNQICHFKNFSIDGLIGRGIRHYLFDTINSENMAQQVLNEKYKTGIQDPLVVVYTGDLNDALKKEIERKFESMGGVENAGKVVPIPSMFDVKQLETKLVNSQFFELQGLNTRKIANAFGVKSFQLNDMEKSTYNNVEQQNKAFYSDTLQNPIIEFEQEMDYVLFPEFERANGCFTRFNVDAILRSTIEERYAAYRNGIDGGFLMPCEAREKEKLPFVKGTDRLIYGNGAAVPLDQIGIQYEK